jgi:Ca-activated chloride channel family protein
VSWKEVTVLDFNRWLVLGVIGVCLPACSDDDAQLRDAARGEGQVVVSPGDSSAETDNAAVAANVPSGPGVAASDAIAGSPGAYGGQIVLAPPLEPGDAYASVGTNPFVMVAHDPLSTFAADADTASYDIFRRDIESGQLPQAESVRLEEYVNYFNYDYPALAHDAAEPFSIALAAAPDPTRAGTTLLRVGIQGKVAPPSEPKPANLVFLVDVSGSMLGADRLPLAQQVLRQTLDLLQPTDTVSIVTYASDTRVRLDPTPVQERATIIAEIDGLNAGGSTAGASGIALAYGRAREGFIPGGINHVILCTDGDFNVGPSSTNELLELIREERRSGVTLTALGFGIGNLNDAMLESVSNAGNGFYGVISSEAQAAEYVQERMLSTLSLIAKDMKIQVELNPALVAAYRLLGYENRAIADDDFRDDLVDAGEIGAGHQVTALYELVLQGQALPDSPNAPEPVSGAAYAGGVEIDAGDLVLVKVRYKTVDATEQDPALEVAASLAPAAIAEADAALDPDFAWAISMAAFAEVLKQSPYANPEALDTLQATFSAQSERDPDRALFLQLFNPAKVHLTAE